MRLKTTIMVLIMLLMTSGAYAGWVFIEDSESENQTTYVQDNKMKLINPDQIIIFDVAKNLVCFANPKQKTFWKGTPSELAKEGNGIVNNMEKMLDEQFSAIPAEARQAMAQAVKDQIKTSSNAKAEVRDSGQSEKVAGYNARKYEMRINGQTAQHQWITTEIQMGKDFDVKRFGEMLKSFTSGFGMAGDRAALASPQVMALLEKGWPLRIVDYQGGSEHIISDVVKVEKKSLTPATFDIPKDYRKVSVMEIFAQ